MSLSQTPSVVLSCWPMTGFEEERRRSSTVFRRLVAKTLAKQLMKGVEHGCSLFQFALSTRAGVDCVGMRCGWPLTGGLLFAFLDDINIVSSVARTRTIYNVLQVHLHKMANKGLEQSWRMPS